MLPVVVEVLADLELEALVYPLFAHVGVDDEHVIGDFVGEFEQAADNNADRVHGVREDHAGE